MTTSKRLFGHNWNGSNLLIGLTLFAGVGLIGTGSYFHFTVVTQVSTGHCDGCAPWHPLFVLAPLGLGLLLGFIGVFLWYRR